MENHDYLIERLYSNILKYFDTFSLVNDRPLLTFRKHIVNKGELEISTYLHYAFNVKEHEESTKKCTSPQLKETLTNLVDVSQSWDIPLTDVLINRNKLCFKLSRPHSFQAVLSAVLNANGQYGSWPPLTTTVSVDADLSCQPTDLTGYRLQLLKNVTENILQRVGYRVSTEVSDVNISFTTKNGKTRNVILIQCGQVIDESGLRINLTLDEYISRREEDMRAMSEHKYWEQDDNDKIHRLAEASVVMDIIQVKINNPVKLNVDESVVARREESSKGCAFIMYNYARLVSIRKKYEDGVSRGLYPPLPSSVDGSLLTEDEEWHLLFDFLLEYPTTLRRTLENLEQGHIAIHLLSSFIFKLCHVFSGYYRRVRILQEAKPHLLPKIAARIQLLRAIEYVLDHALGVLNIKGLEHM